MKSITWVALKGRLTATGTSVSITDEYSGSPTTTPASRTNESVVAITDDLKTWELMQVSCSGGIMTIVKRGLDNSSTRTEVPALKKERGPNTKIYVTALAPDFISGTTTNTFTADQTFNGNATHNGTETFNGVVNMGALGDLNVTGTSNPQPNFANTTQRDAVYISPLNGDKCTVNGVEQNYNGTTAQWESFGISTPVPNASTIAAGIVKIGAALTDPDQVAGVYNMTPNSAIKSYVDTNIVNNNTGTQAYVLGENIIAGAISVLPDGLAYKLTNNKRNMNNGVITGQTTTKSKLLPNNKIVTVGLASNTLTIYIGTIDYAGNTITYGTGVQLTTNCLTNFSLAKAGTDSLAVIYETTGYACCGRAVSISGTIPTVGSEMTIDAGGGVTYPSYPSQSCYVTNGFIATNVHTSQGGSAKEYVYKLSVSSTTLAVIGSYNTGNQSAGCGTYDLQYVVDNIIAWAYQTAGTNYSFVLFDCSGTNPSAGGVIGTGIKNQFATDGINIWILTTATNVAKYTYTGSTLSSVVWNATVSTATGICVIGNLIGVVSGTTLTWYSQSATGLVAKNTIDYSISLANINENAYSNNYCLFTVSGNPSYVYKIGNENRGVMGYYNGTGNLGDTKSIIIQGGIVSLLSNIIPGEVYYLTYSTGAIGLNGDIVFGRGLTITSIKLNIAYLA